MQKICLKIDSPYLYFKIDLKIVHFWGSLFSFKLLMSECILIDSQFSCFYWTFFSLIIIKTIHFLSCEVLTASTVGSGIL